MYWSAPVIVKNLGEDELAQEQARQKKASVKALHEQANQVKYAAGGSDADDVTTETAQKGPTIPSDVGGFLTHQCLGIFELMDNGLITPESVMVEPSSRVQVLYQESLQVTTPESMKQYLGKWNDGEPMLLQVTDFVQKPPEWWTQCSQQLKRTCSAAIPENMSPSSYVTVFDFSCNLFFLVYRSVILNQY